jgi:hypothetical protein
MLQLWVQMKTLKYNYYLLIFVQAFLSHLVNVISDRSVQLFVINNVYAALIQHTWRRQLSKENKSRIFTLF